MISEDFSIGERQPSRGALRSMLLAESLLAPLGVKSALSAD